MKIDQGINCQEGVTLVELLVTLALSFSTVAAVYGIHLVQIRQQRFQEEGIAMQQNVRAAMDMIVREVRMAGYDPMGVNSDGNSTNDFFGVTVESNGMGVRADLNGNGVLGDSNETVVYSWDKQSLTLRRKVGAGGRQPVGDYIEKAVFLPLNRQGVTTSDPRTIQTVEIQLRGRTQHPDSLFPENDGFRTFELRSQVTPRNLYGPP